MTIIGGVVNNKFKTFEVFRKYLSKLLKFLHKIFFDSKIFKEFLLQISKV